MRPPPERASSRGDRAPNPVAVRLFDAVLGVLLRPRARRVRRWSFLVTVPLGFFAGRSLGLDLGDGVLLGMAAAILDVLVLLGVAVAGARLAELRDEKGRLEAELAETGSEVPEASFEEIADALKRLPDLSKELRNAPPELKRQVFEAFDLRVIYSKLERRIEISATVSEAVAEAFHNAKDLPKEVQGVAQRDIAGARYVPPSDARVVERMRFAA